MKLPLIIALCLSALTGGCVSSTDLPPVVSRLDERTGVTVEAMGEPYILARALEPLAGSARDYLDLRLIDVDRMGKHRYYLSLVAFTTVARPDDALGVGPGIEKITLRIAGQPTELAAVTGDAEASGLTRRLFPERNGQQATAEYPVSAGLIHALAAADARDLVVELGADASLRYESWQPAEESLHRFAERTPPTSR